MVKVKVIEKFTLKNFKELQNVSKVAKRKENEFNIGDTFECDEKMVDYLTGNNPIKKQVVEIIEVKPKEETKEVEEEVIEEEAVEHVEEETKPKVTFKKKKNKK